MAGLQGQTKATGILTAAEETKAEAVVPTSVYQGWWKKASQNFKNPNY